MAHDPTAWPTPMHGYVYWFDKANQYEKDVYEIQAAYERKHGPGSNTDILIRDDPDYQQAIQNQQFAERRAQTFGQAATIRLLEALIAEVRNPRRPPSW